jgi:hypothetical protein
MVAAAHSMRRLAAAALLAWAGAASAGESRIADFGEAPVSGDAVDTADWILRTDDHQGSAFILVDKRQARVHVLDRNGMLVGSSPVLLGLARGDYSTPGIGERPMKSIREYERTTPAGRFVARPARNARGEDIIWVDFDASVAMHRVREVNTTDHRMQRLATRATLDKRISYGCINVPVGFYDTVLQPAAKAGAVIYVLPESMPAAEWFGFIKPRVDAAATAHAKLYEPGPQWARLTQFQAR